MTEITKKTVNERDLTIYSIVGDFKGETLKDLLDQFYQSQYTANLVFDFSETKTVDISTDEIEGIIAHAKLYAHLRRSGKTAYIVSSEVNFGMGRMYVILAEMNNHPIPQRVFRSLEEAIKWFEI